MKLIHLADLHIGKAVDRMKMLEDQKYILARILDIIEDELPDAVLISGDVYDRGVPPSEAVTMLDEFVCRLSRITLPGGERLKTFIISGNHDSPERLAFGSSLMSGGGVYISPVYNGSVEPISLFDEFGEVLVYMLPFIKPAHVREVLKESHEEAEKIVTYTDAVAKAIELMQPDKTKRKVLLSHQFVIGGDRSDSETRSVGGLDEVDISVYAPFNYVALGHLHKPQTLTTRGGSRNVVCYSGTPLKYSFSETTEKSVPVVTIDGGGSVSVRRRPLSPLRDMRTVEGTFEEICEKSEHSDDYIRVVLHDEQLPPHVYHELRSLYPNLLTTVTSSERVSREGRLIGSDITADQDEFEIFSQFFALVNGRGLSDDEAAHMTKLIERIQRDRLNGERTVSGDASD